MRVRLSTKNRDAFFTEIENQMSRQWAEDAGRVCGVHPRTVREWRRGKYTIPLAALHKLSQILGVVPPVFETMDMYWYTHKGARQGGLRRQELYGNLGTPEGRRRGGLNSIRKNRLLKTPSFVLKDIVLPRFSAELAEFVGILLGDGGITSYQTTITLHKVDDGEYAQYVAQLGEKLFGIAPSLRTRKQQNVCVVVFSSVKLVQYLNHMGLPIGNKVRQQASVPGWVTARANYTKACLRGLMDTDGCFYIDKHQHKDKVYFNAALNFTNRSKPLLEFVIAGLRAHNFHPTQRTEFSVFLRREGEIREYFAKICSSNPKHKNKFSKYLQRRYGEVPKWS